MLFERVDQINCSGADDGVLCLNSSDSGEAVDMFAPPGGSSVPVTDCAIANDTVAGGYADGAVHTFSLLSGKFECSYRNNSSQASVGSIGFNNRGNVLAVAQGPLISLYKISKPALATGEQQ